MSGKGNQELSQVSTSPGERDAVLGMLELKASDTTLKEA